MYVTLRKYQTKTDFAAVHAAVEAGLLPILRGCPGFRSHWLLNCDDGDVAAVTVFDTEEQAREGVLKAVGWVQAHIHDLLVLPPNAMFGASAEQFT